MRVKAYHFNDGFLGYGDGREIVEGKTISLICGKPALCFWGLHGSRDILDALCYAPDDTKYLSVVEIWGDIDESSDKLCGTHRKCVKQIPCKHILYPWTTWCVDQARHQMEALGPAYEEEFDEALERYPLYIYASPITHSIIRKVAYLMLTLRQTTKSEVDNLQRNKLLEMLGLTEVNNEM